MPDSDRVIVRRVSSFQPQRLGRERKFEVDEAFSTQRSVLVSRVRVEVGEKKLYKKKKNIKVTLKPRKKPKTFLDSLFSKLKSFAKVTLSSREISENLHPFNHLNGSGVSLGNGKRGKVSAAMIMRTVSQGSQIVSMVIRCILVVSHILVYTHSVTSMS